MIDPMAVQSRMDLASFVAGLVTDLKQRPEEWENPTLDRYLDALSSYLYDLPGWCRNISPETDPDKAQWQLFAVALAGAVVYE